MKKQKKEITRKDLEELNKSYKTFVKYIKLVREEVSSELDETIKKLGGQIYRLKFNKPSWEQIYYLELPFLLISCFEVIKYAVDKVSAKELKEKLNWTNHKAHSKLEGAKRWIEFTERINKERIEECEKRLKRLSEMSMARIKHKKV